jgi:hypothetical protein
LSLCLPPALRGCLAEKLPLKGINQKMKIHAILATKRNKNEKVPRSKLAEFSYVKLGLLWSEELSMISRAERDLCTFKGAFVGL